MVQFIFQMEKLWKPLISLSMYWHVLYKVEAVVLTTASFSSRYIFLVDLEKRSSDASTWAASLSWPWLRVVSVGRFYTL